MNVKKVGSSWEYDFRHNKKRYRKRGFKTKKAATKAMNEIYNDIVHGSKLTNTMPFIDYFKEWIKVNKENVISDSTLSRYYNALKVFEEKFGLISICDVSQLKYREMLKEYANGEFLGGRRVGRTKQSVSKLNNCFSQAFKDALNEKLIERDPTYNAPIYEKKPAKSEEDKYMNIKDFMKLKRYSISKNKQSYLCLFILISTGARFSEVQRLKYSDVLEVSSEIHLPGTKTKSANRTIKIPNKDMKHIQYVLKELPRSFNGFIFNTGANLITNKAVTTTMKNFLLENGIKNYTLHALRHTHASLLLSEGFSIQYISKRLGHSNIEITWRVYSHLLEEFKTEEDEKLDRIANF